MNSLYFMVGSFDGKLAHGVTLKIAPTYESNFSSVRVRLEMTTFGARTCGHAVCGFIVSHNYPTSIPIYSIDTLH